MNLLEVAIERVVLAGEAALKVREEGLVVYGSGFNPVTRGDEVSHKLLMELEALTSIPVLSEELGLRAYQSVLNKNPAKLFWLVDPIDGTKEYAAGSDEFVVSVALVEKGKPVLGVISAPALGWIMYGEREQGSFKKELTSGIESRLRVSDIKDFERMRLLASPKILEPRDYPQYSYVMSGLGYSPQDPRVRIIGSIALKAALIADGEAEYLFSLPLWNTHHKTKSVTREWDIAAAWLLLGEAGGVMTDLLGRELEFCREDPLNHYGILASNSPAIHPWLCKRIQQEQKNQIKCPGNGEGYTL